MGTLKSKSTTRDSRWGYPSSWGCRYGSWKPLLLMAILAMLISMISTTTLYRQRLWLHNQHRQRRRNMSLRDERPRMMIIPVAQKSHVKTRHAAAKTMFAGRSSSRWIGGETWWLTFNCRFGDLYCGDGIFSSDLFRGGMKTLTEKQDASRIVTLKPNVVVMQQHQDKPAHWTSVAVNSDSAVCLIVILVTPLVTDRR